MSAGMLLWVLAGFMALGYGGWRLLVVAGQQPYPAVGAARLGCVIVLLGGWGAMYTLLALTTDLL